MTILDGILSDNPLPMPQSLFGQVLILSGWDASEGRYIFHQNPGYLEEAIFSLSCLFRFTSLEDPDRSENHSLSGRTQGETVRGIRVTNGLPETCSNNAEVVDLPSFSDLAASLTELDAVKSHSMEMGARI